MLCSQEPLRNPKQDHKWCAQHVISNPFQRQFGSPNILPQFDKYRIESTDVHSGTSGGMRTVALATKPRTAILPTSEYWPLPYARGIRVSVAVRDPIINGMHVSITTRLAREKPASSSVPLCLRPMDDDVCGEMS